MRNFIIISFIFLIAGCSIPVGYNKFTITNPSNAIPVTADTSRYTDDKIDIIFSVIKDSMFAGVEADGFSQYWQYRGIAFTLINKTDEVITVDWNKISFKDYLGNSGPVMHQGIKYNECVNIRAPFTIPPKGRLTDTIIPCDSLKFVTAVAIGINMSRWESSILPSPRTSPISQFGVFMPLQIGAEISNYTFEFQAQ